MRTLYLAGTASARWEAAEGKCRALTSRVGGDADTPGGGAGDQVAVGGGAFISDGGGGSAVVGCSNAVPMAPDLSPWSDDPHPDMTPAYTDVEET